MNTPTNMQPARHRQYLGGVASRYAAHLLMMGTLLAIGVGLLLMAASRPASGTLVPGLLFAVGALLVLIPMYRGLTRQPSEIETSAEGLKWLDGEGEHSADWADVREVFRYERITNQTFREKHLIFVLTDGCRVDLDQCLSDFDQLGDTVQTTVCARRMPALRADFQAGGAEFGPVLLRPGGLRLKGQEWTWSEMEQVLVSRGCLNVCVKQPRGTRWEDVAIAAIPNFPVFLHLLREASPAPVQRE